MKTLFFQLFFWLFLGLSAAHAADLIAPVEPGRMAKIKDYFWSKLSGKKRIFPIYGEAIFNAVKAGKLDEINQLLNLGENILATNDDGRNIFAVAVENGQDKLLDEMLNLLQKSQVDINTIGGFNDIDHTLLHEAASKGFLDVVKVLLSHNANINARTFNGFTPLALAVRSNHLDVAADLLSKNADTDTGESHVSGGPGGGARYKVHNPSLMAMAKSLDMMQLLRKWSIKNRTKLPDSDIALLFKKGLGTAKEYLEEFETYKEPE